MREYTIECSHIKSDMTPILWNNHTETNPSGETLAVTNLGLYHNHQPYFTIAGEFHYGRCPKEDWEDGILKMKATGINVISTYVFWIYHEEEEGVYDWSGSNDLRHFLKLCEKHQMFVLLRVGPYAHGEVRNGGFPDWLYGRHFQVRSNDEDYLYYVRRLYTEIAHQIRGRKYKDGGCIIGIQLENEYLHASSSWVMTYGQGMEYTGIGTDSSHLTVLKKMAEELELTTLMMTMTGWESVPPEDGSLLPMLGGYGYKPWYIHKEGDQMPLSDNYIFKDRHYGQPYPIAYCELMGGMTCHYQARFRVQPESIPAITGNATLGGSHFLGYYMYQGGNNPVGRHCFLNDHHTPKIDYDFQAPIGAYGQIRKSADYLRPLHAFLTTWADQLFPMSTCIPEMGAKTPSDDTKLRYAVRTNGREGYIFLNNFQDHLELPDQKDFSIKVDLIDEVITLPQKGRLNLKSMQSCILPFNMNLDGLLLKTATVQPITKIVHDGVTTYFFQMMDGMKPEMMIKGPVDFLPSSHVETINDGIIICPSTESRSLISLGQNGLYKVNLCILTAEEALKFWQFDCKGQSYALISEIAPLLNQDCLSLDLKGCQNTKISIFPPLGDLLTMPDNEDVALDRCIEEDFETITLTMDEYQPASTYVIHGNKAQVFMDEKDLKSLSQLWLVVDYEGDVGNALIRGQLIQDNFYNGDPWEIGLLRFKDKLEADPLDLHIRPKQDGEFILLESDMALQTRFNGTQLGVIHALKLIPERRIQLLLK